jgi:hypothetical protein
MEDRIFDDAPRLQVFKDDPLEERRRDASVPYPFRVNYDDGATRADTEAWNLAALYSRRSEEKPLALQERRKLRVERVPLPTG